MEQKIRLLLVDDHTLFREGLARLLEAESGLDLVGNFSTAEEALEALEHDSVHVVLLDFELGEKNGLHFFRSFQEKGFPGKILMVTGGMSHADTFRALKQGASGVFLKHNPPSDLITAIRRVAGGEMWLDATSVSSLVGGGEAATIKTPSAPVLNAREQEVLKGVFEGLANKEIAAHLGISESYVKAVLQQLFAKSGVRTRSQLVRVALEKRIE